MKRVVLILLLMGITLSSLCAITSWAVAEETSKEKGKSNPSELPDWVEKMKLKGDFRLRYQGQETDNNGITQRSRGRFRWRLGVETHVTEQWKAGVGLASGGSDPRSTNQTFQDTFQSPDARIDYAYAQYEPFKMLKLMGGKFKNPIWSAKDLLWDGDIRPDGLAAQIKWKYLSDLELFATPAFFILEEFSGDTADPVMWVLQVGVNWKFADNMYLKLAPTYYATDNVRGNDFSLHGSGTNTVDANGDLVFEYNAWAADVELGVRLSGPVPFASIYGQYVNSTAKDSVRPTSVGSDDNIGWLAGVKFGHKKVKKFGQWQAKLNYRELETDAWPDFLPDSDFYDGATNAKGHEIELALGLNEHVTLGFDYYHTEPIRIPAGATSLDQDLVQIDLVLKW